MPKNSERLQKINSHFIFPLILFLVCMNSINRGIDVSDTMYSLSSDVLFPKAQGDWNLFMAYYLANFVGFIFTKLPFGHTVIGMNFYTSLVLYATVLMVYFYFGKRKEISYGLLFFAELLALCFHWCPTTVLYNFLSYFLWTAAFLLLRSVWSNPKGNQRCLLACFFAGVILGVSVFAKFTNITGAIMILPVMFYSLLSKEAASKIWKKIGCCVGGFFTGFLILWIIMETLYGGGTFAQMVMSLFAMTDTATDYKADSMLSAIWQYYQQALPFVVGILLLILAGSVFFAAFQAHRFQKLCQLAKILYVGALVLLIRLYYGRGLFGIDYTKDFAVIFIGAMLAWFAIGGSLWTIFGKGKRDSEKADSLLVLLLVFITPLGSNNGLYPLLNNFCLILPLAISGWLKNLNRLEKTPYMYFPMKAAVIAFLVLALIQGGLFTTHFTFKGQDEGKMCDTKVENNVILKGMSTNAERAEALGELLAAAEETLAQIQERNLLTYGNIPGMFFLLKGTTPVLSTTWPDLASYSTKNFEQKLQLTIGLCKEKGKEPPLMILTQEVYSSLTGEVDLPKETVLKEFMETLEYDMIFENDDYVMLYPAGGIVYDKF